MFEALEPECKACMKTEFANARSTPKKLPIVRGSRYFFMTVVPIADNATAQRDIHTNANTSL